MPEGDDFCLPSLATGADGHFSHAILPDPDGPEVRYKPLARAPIDPSAVDQDASQCITAYFVPARKPLRPRHLAHLPPHVHRVIASRAAHCAVCGHYMNLAGLTSRGHSTRQRPAPSSRCVARVCTPSGNSDLKRAHCAVCGHYRSLAAAELRAPRPGSPRLPAVAAVPGGQYSSSLRFSVRG
jgi:hypothetical protein